MRKNEREKRQKAATDIRRITERVYANDTNPGQVFRVIRDHHKTILKALEVKEPRKAVCVPASCGIDCDCHLCTFP